jgi:hypothetical protein
VDQSLTREARASARAKELIAARQLQGSRTLARAVVVVSLISLPFVVGITLWLDRALGVRLVAVTLGVAGYFGAMLLLIRAGWYRPWLDWVNATLEVSLPSAIAVIDTVRVGPAYALTSAPVMLYALVASMTALRLRPRLALFVGALGAAELAGLYVAVRAGIPAELVRELPSLGASNVLQRSAYVFVGGLGGYWLCRSLLALMEDLIAEHSAREALFAEMEVAKKIQTALLPKDGRLGRFQIAAIMHPAAEVGGDYYEIVTTRAGEHWVAIGDVSGHGLESGLVMMMAQTSILTQINDVAGRSPSEVFCAVNGVICENSQRLGGSRYMTLNLIRLQDDRLTLAGKHQDVLVHRRGTSQVETVGNEGSWLGVVPDLRGRIEDSQIQVGEGDTILLFTDGATEAASASGELFEQERLTQAFARVAHLPLPAALKALVDEVKRFQVQQQDDLTFMLLRRESAA